MVGLAMAMVVAIVVMEAMDMAAAAHLALEDIGRMDSTEN